MSENFKTLEELLIINIKQLEIIKESIGGLKGFFETVSKQLERMHVLIEMLSESLNIEMEEKWGNLAIFLNIQ